MKHVVLFLLLILPFWSCKKQTSSPKCYTCHIYKDVYADLPMTGYPDTNYLSKGYPCLQ